MKLGDNRGMDILLVEDDDAIAASLISGLATSGMTVRRVSNGADAVAAEIPDVVLLDIGLPDFDGFEVCRRIRQKSQVPIIMLTARGDEIDRVAGLDAGADDYIAKPFSTKELLARVRAVLRRRAPEQVGGLVTIGGLSLDASTYRVTYGEQLLKLGPTEFKLLNYFMTHAERVHSRSQLLDKVWGDHVFIEERTVDVHVKRLRESLGPLAGQMIETVRGAGYRLTGKVVTTLPAKSDA